MAFRRINIPGASTRFDDAPKVWIKGDRNQPITLTIQYHASEIATDLPVALGEITFISVLEYRWIADSVDYSDFKEHEDDFDFGLLEITNSSYIENMASRGVFQNEKEKMFGYGISKDQVHHFRIAFDDYGLFEIIALGVEVRQVSAE